MANTAYKKKKEYKILAIIHTLEKNIHLYLHVQYLNTVRFFFCYQANDLYLQT